MLISIPEWMFYFSCLVEEIHRGIEFAGALAYWYILLSEVRA